MSGRPVTLGPGKGQSIALPPTGASNRGTRARCRSSRHAVRASGSGTVAAAMAFLADLERLLERVFERSSARVFRTRVQAVQVEHRVERAMERARLSKAGVTSVPDRYRVRLTPADLAVAAGEMG